MPLLPQNYVALSLPALVRDLAGADPADVPLPRPAEVVPHGPGTESDTSTTRPDPSSTPTWDFRVWARFLPE